MTINDTNEGSLPRSSRGRVLRPVGQWWVTAPGALQRGGKQIPSLRRPSMHQSPPRPLNTSCTMPTTRASLCQTPSSTPRITPPRDTTTQVPIQDLHGSLSTPQPLSKSLSSPSSPTNLQRNKSSPSPPLSPLVMKFRLSSPSLSPSPSPLPSSLPSPLPSLCLPQVLTNDAIDDPARNCLVNHPEPLRITSTRESITVESTGNSKNTPNSLPLHARTHDDAFVSVTANNIGQDFCSRCSKLSSCGTHAQKGRERCFICRPKIAQHEETDSESLVSFKFSL